MVEEQSRIGMVQTKGDDIPRANAYIMSWVGHGCGCTLLASYDL
jgi:hypothetical protein